jgi:4-alpha-glucanotransferase
MTTDPRLALAARMGILPGYHDLSGHWRETAPDSAEALVAAMGVASADEAEARLAALPRDVIFEAGGRPDLDLWDTPWQLICDDGRQLEGQGPLPELPLGIHRLTARGICYTLLAAPARLPEPARCFTAFRRGGSAAMTIWAGWPPAWAGRARHFWA